MKKIYSVDEVNMGDVLLYKNLLGTVSFFDEGEMVILETIVEIEIMTENGMSSLAVGSDYAVDVTDCLLVLSRAEMNNPVIDF